MRLFFIFFVEFFCYNSPKLTNLVCFLNKKFITDCVLASYCSDEATLSVSLAIDHVRLSSQTLYIECSSTSGSLTTVPLISGRGKRGAFSELTGSMSRAAGKKINRIITFSKRKPPLPGETPSSSAHLDNPRFGEYTNESISYLLVDSIFQ